MPRTYSSPQRDKITAYGIDQIIERLGQGETQTEIARELGVSVMTLNQTLHADAVSSARVEAAQLASAERYELEAVAILNEARREIVDNPGISGSIVALARERSQACWRRASVLDRSRYGDTRKLDVSVKHSHDIAQLPTAELERMVQTLQLDNDTGEVSDH